MTKTKEELLLDNAINRYAIYFISGYNDLSNFDNHIYYYDFNYDSDSKKVIYTFYQYEKSFNRECVFNSRLNIVESNDVK